MQIEKLFVNRADDWAMRVASQQGYLSEFFTPLPHQQSTHQANMTANCSLQKQAANLPSFFGIAMIIELH